MARSEGQVLERTSKGGRGYALRFLAYGERRYLTLRARARGLEPQARRGGAPEGPRQRAPRPLDPAGARGSATRPDPAGRFGFVVDPRRLRLRAGSNFLTARALFTLESGAQPLTLRLGFCVRAAQQPRPRAQPRFTG